MDPGERVNLIRKAAETLRPEGWAEIDLILDQFGFPTASEDWGSGTERMYIMAMLKDAPDDRLAALDAYLHPGEVPPTEPQPDVVDAPESPWTTGGFRLFITHLATEKRNVGMLKTALALHSIEGFVAHETIAATSEWENVIKSGLRTCDALAVWLTNGIKESSWCDQEVGYGVCRGSLILPLSVDMDPYGFVARYQALRVPNPQSFPVLARAIFDLLVRHEQSREAMARALVWRYENSGSFTETRANVGYLRRIPPEAWTPALKEQARTAHERNYEVREAWVGEGYAADEVAEIVPSDF